MVCSRWIRIQDSRPAKRFLGLCSQVTVPLERLVKDNDSSDQNLTFAETGRISIPREAG